MIRLRTAGIAFAAAALALPLAAFAAAGSPYVQSNLGYDLSYNATWYPGIPFGFSIVGVTRGKAFVDNSRFFSEYSWAKFGSGTAPTIYLNLNAPYGSTVAGNISAPKACPPGAAPSATSTGSGQAEPTACQGYNYGYNAAAHSFGYAKGVGAASSIWWLDIEEANSWSASTTVNDATIQGAIDYLNAQNVRVGIYSMPFMWNDIAGSAFVPTQSIGGVAISIPNWLPIGVVSQVGATNACVTKKGFIAGSPIWLVQYEATATSTDQNIAC